MTNTPARYLSAATSHQGVVRGNNEDRVHADDARGIYLVIDGMGGHAAGERAAEIARDVIKTRLERLTGETEQRMREAITLANNAIFEAAQRRTRSVPAWPAYSPLWSLKGNVPRQGTSATRGCINYAAAKSRS